jgi:hypothetical protein
MKKVWMASMVLGGLAVAAPAFADQCAWVSRAQFNKANAILARAKQYISFCEPCGDTKPSAPKASAGLRGSPTGVSRLVDVQPLGPRGRPVKPMAFDLAYTYVPSAKPGIWANLAKLAGCPAQGVSPTIRVAASTGAQQRPASSQRK